MNKKDKTETKAAFVCIGIVAVFVALVYLFG